MSKQLPYVNLGCGKIILPAPKPMHHMLISDNVHDYALWANVDIIPSDGVDVVADIFDYPWEWAADNSFDGALLTHIVEHIDHGVGDRDGFYQFFEQLHRALTNGSYAHIIVPYAFSTGAVQDPDHKRYLTPETFTYLVPNPDAPFVLPDGGAWAIEEMRYGLTDHAAAYPDPAQLERALVTQWNIAHEFYVKLRVVKP